MKWLLIMMVGAVAHGASMVDLTFDPGVGGNNVVEQALELTDGKVLACGLFTTFNNQSRPWIVRLNADGSLDESFLARPSGWVRHMVVQPDGKIVVAGFFSFMNGVKRNLIARLNPDGTLDTTFDPGLGFEVDLAEDIYHNAQPDVMWLELQPDGKILAAGDFRQYNGQSNNGFARINPDGSRDNTFQLGSGLDSWGRSIRVLADGKILLTGWFTTYNGQPFNRIVRLFPDGTPDHSFNAYYGDKTSVYSAVQLPDGKIITAGHSLNTTFTREVVRLNPDGSIDPTWVGTTNEKTECVLLQEDGKTIFGGYFWLVNGEGSHQGVARLNADGTVDPTFTAQTDNLVWTVAPARNNKILLSGGFSHVDGITRNGVVRLNLPDPPAQIGDDRPMISNPRLNGSAFECGVLSAAGYTYTLQFKTTMESADWTSLSPVAGTGAPIVLTDNAAEENRFYRVQATKL